MATFEAKKLELTQINGGQEYEQGDFLQSDTINDVVEGTAYAQNVAEEANTKSNNAVSTANSANSTANAASAKVDTFDQRITTAQNTADTAVSNAATAQSTADSATTEINKIKNGTTVVPNANHANNADSADLATKAKQDVNGNPINTTYATREFVAEQQGTRVKVNNANVAELSFTSDPQTQITANKNAIAEAQSDINDIVSGAQTVGKATQDAKGNVIDETYATKAELGDVSNFAVPSSITNTTRDSGLWAISIGDPGGTLLLGTFSVYDTNIKLRVSGGIASSAGDTTIDVDVFISTANHIVYKAEYYVRSMYTTSSLSGLYYTLDDSYNLRVFVAIPAYGKVFVSAEVAGGTIAGRGSSEPQYPSGGAYLERKDYVALDPSKLAPSTANGWTQTTATGSLPSAGVYMVVPNASLGTLGIGIMFYAENRLSAAAIGSVGDASSLFYAPSGDTRWVLYSDNGTQIQLTDVYYKRIA